MTDLLPNRQSIAPFLIRHKVRWGDCDPAGVVYTPRFADYVVEAHLAFLEDVFGAPPRESLKPLDLALPAKAIVIEFKRSLWPDQFFDMSVQVAAVRVHTFDLDIVGLSLDNEEAFAAKLTLICISTALRKREPLPQFVRNKLSASAGRDDWLRASPSDLDVAQRADP